MSGAESHEAGTYTLVADCLITFTAPEGTANLTGGHTMSYSFTPYDQGESALLDLRADGALLLRIALTLVPHQTVVWGCVLRDSTFCALFQRA